MDQFFLAYLFGATVYIVWGIYWGHKFIQYCRTHYPEKAREFMRLGIFSLIKATFKQHDIDDLDFVILKNKAKNGFTCICFVFLLGIFFYFAHQKME